MDKYINFLKCTYRIVQTMDKWCRPWISAGQGHLPREPALRRGRLYLQHGPATPSHHLIYMPKLPYPRPNAHTLPSCQTPKGLSWLYTDQPILQSYIPYTLNLVRIPLPLEWRRCGQCFDLGSLSHQSGRVMINVSSFPTLFEKHYQIHSQIQSALTTKLIGRMPMDQVLALMFEFRQTTSSMIRGRTVPRSNIGTLKSVILYGGIHTIFRQVKLNIGIN